MAERSILFVDDEPNVLEGIRRTLYEQFDFATATSGVEALDLIASRGPFAVVVSDMRMPGMNGAEFLSRVRDMAPDTVRMLLTGHSDLDATISAVNEGQIFRFLTKPCPSSQLASALEAAIAQHRLITGERELLEDTLNGAINVLVEVLGLAAPGIFAQAHQLRICVSHLVHSMNLHNPWRFELAALLAHLGHIAIPQDILRKAEIGQPLSNHEQSIFDEQYEVTYKLLVTIPRLGEVAELIRSQSQPHPANSFQERDMQLGASALRLGLLASALIKRGKSLAAAAEELAHGGDFHPTLIRSLAGFSIAAPTKVSKELPIAKLLPGMVLEADVVTPKGIVVVPQGREVTATILERLRSFSRGHGIVEPIAVTVYTPS